MKRIILIGLIVCIVGVLTACSTIRSGPVSYRSGDVTLKGYLAYDAGIKEKRPGILVIHEWWGHNEYARMRARMFADLGYTALAVDMYGEGKVADHPKDAGKFAQEVWDNMDTSKARFLAAMDVLKRHETVDPTRIAVIGYCFGGGVAIQMAREGLDIDGVVSFHGTLATNRQAQPGTVKAKIMVAHGADDKFVTPEQVEVFRKEMENAGVTYSFMEYSGATHSFTNPEADKNAEKFNIPIAYNKDADRKSWIDMQRFLNEIFKQ